MASVTDFSIQSCPTVMDLTHNRFLLNHSLLSVYDFCRDDHFAVALL